MTAHKIIYIGPYVEGEGRLWCQDNVWLDCEQDEVDTYINAGDNFETALAALIEHHSADALTSLAAVMRHYDLTFLVEGLIIDQSNKLIFESTYEVITELDIKPEK